MKASLFSGDDGYAEETELRKDYPLLCARFLDGYSEAQVARGQMWPAAKLRVELDIELYSFKRDKRSRFGTGKAVLAMAEGKDRVHRVCVNRPSPSW